MDISCTNCGRQFVIREDAKPDERVATCLCGAPISLDPARGPKGEQRLGKYTLIHRIAVGGMGEVYYGKIAGVEGFEREVAIKKMLPHLSADRKFVDMLVKEAKLTVRLNHPNIVQVLDLAREGDEYYLAMEFVPGSTLAALLEASYRLRTLLPVDVAVFITMQILRGLAYAHALKGQDGQPMQILHRDITPQNILVTRAGWAKLTDFGIAKARNEISTTRPGVIKGKLGYLAPEQLQSGPITQGVDIFCAGIVLWESLTTQRLFKGADEIDTFQRIAKCAIPPLKDYRDDVSPELEGALQRALAPIVSQRYTSAQEFYEALNTAIFPRAIDDIAGSTQRFFDANSEFFQGSEATGEQGETPTPTVLLGEDEAEITSDPLPSITEFLSGRTVERTLDEVPERARSSSVTPMLLAALLLVAGIGGGWYLMQARSGTQGASLAPLSASEVQIAVDAEHATIAECYGDRGASDVGHVKARVQILSTGSVSSVTLPESLDHGASCVRDVLKALRFRNHDAPAFTAEVTIAMPGAERVASTRKSPTTPTREPKPKPRKSSKSGPLTNAEIQATIQRGSAGIVACFKQLDAESAPDSINATVAISGSGTVRDVSLAPSPPKAVAGCLQKKLRSLRFRSHPGKEIKVTVPLKIRVL